MAGFTSACGTLSLLTFKVGSIQQFGVSGCIGTLFCTLYTLTLNPAILSLLKAPPEKTLLRFREGTENGLWKFLVKVGKFAIANKPVVLAVVLVVCAISLYGTTKIKTGQDTIAWFPKDHHVRIAADLLNDKIGGTTAIWAMIDGGEEDAMKDPAVLGHVKDFQDFATSLPEIGKSSSFADVVRLLNQEMHEGNEDFYVIPDSRNLVSQYLLLYSMSGDPDDFESLVIDYQYTSVVMPVNTFRVQSAKRYLQKTGRLRRSQFSRTPQIGSGRSQPSICRHRRICHQRQDHQYNSDPVDGPPILYGGFPLLYRRPAGHDSYRPGHPDQFWTHGLLRYPPST